LFPAFYAKAELAKNLSATIYPGLAVYKPKEGDMTMQFQTRAALTFYFM
jgi:hypothetical protein